jgi:hypothetical protein
MPSSNIEAIKKFLLPEKELSLKVVFDNIRNYAIIGGIIFIARWFQSGKATAPPYIFNGPPHGGWGPYAWVFLAIALILFVLNAGQTYCIWLRLNLFGLAEDSPVSSGTLYEKLFKQRWYIIIGVYVFALSMTAVVLLMFVMMLNFIVYLAWFPAAGGFHN